jgi:ACS family allantoate permease-like MFS transporter
LTGYTATDPDKNDDHSILGSALVYATESIAARYAGLLLMGVYSVSMPLSLAMVASNIGGFSKRATVSAIYFVMYCTGNIVGPQLFYESEAPKYQVCCIQL